MLTRSKKRTAPTPTENEQEVSASTVKVKRTTARMSTAASLPPPNLLSLPFVVQKHLLQFFDVKSLESLSSTCSFYDQLIAGSNLLALDFPLTMSMLEEIRDTDEIQKKPLLKINCKKSKKSEQTDKQTMINMFSTKNTLVCGCFVTFYFCFTFNHVFL